MLPLYSGWGNLGLGSGHKYRTGIIRRGSGPSFLCPLYLCSLANHNDFALRMEAAWFPEAVVSYHITTCHQNPGLAFSSP